MKFILIWSVLFVWPLQASLPFFERLEEENFPIFPLSYHKGDDIKYWNTGPFDHFSALNDTKVLGVIQSEDCNTFIDEITLHRNKSGLESVFIRSRIDIRVLDIKQNYKLFNMLRFRSDLHDLKDFLTSLQKINYLPNCLFDVIISTLGVEDFRFTEDVFISQLNVHVKDDATVDDFRTALTKTLATIPPSHKTQHWIAVVIRHLVLNNGDRDLLMELCSQVQDPAATPLFNEIRKTESELFFTDRSGRYTRNERHLLAIQSLLRISKDREAQRMLKLWIKSLRDGPSLTSMTLPDPLVGQTPFAQTITPLSRSMPNQQADLIQLENA